jgi:hypothetical protein
MLYTAFLASRTNRQSKLEFFADKPFKQPGPIFASTSITNLFDWWQRNIVVTYLASSSLKKTKRNSGCF